MPMSDSLEGVRAQPSYRAMQQRKPPEILILDPDPDSRRILGAFLGASGYSTVEAASIEDVKWHTPSSGFALVISESRGEDEHPSLPLAVRDDLGLTGIPLVVHTSWVHPDDELAAVAAGALAFIAKPCDYRALLRCVARIIPPTVR